MLQKWNLAFIVFLIVVYKVQGKQQTSNQPEKDLSQQEISYAEAKLFLTSSKSYLKAKDYFRAEQSATLAIKELGKLNKFGDSIFNLHFDIVYALSSIYLKTSRIDELEPFLDTAISFIEEQNSPTPLANLLNLKGTYMFSLGEFSACVEAFRGALNIYHRDTSQIAAASVLFNLGLLHKRQGAFDDAISFFLQANQAFNSEKMLLEEGKSLNAIGSIYRSLKNHTKAIEYQSKALAIFRETKDSLYISVSLNSVGVTCLESESIKKALRFFQEALKIRQILGLKKPISATLHNIGLAYMELKPDSAIHYLNQSESLKKEINDFYGLSSLNNDIGRFYLQENQLNKASEYLDYAEKMAKKIRARQLLLDNYQYNKQLSYLKHDLPRALSYSEKHDSLHQLMHQIEMRKASEALEAKYQNEKKEQQLLVQNAQIKVQQLQLTKEKSKKYYLRFIIALLGLMIVLLMLWLRNRRKAHLISLERNTLQSIIDGREKERRKVATELHNEIGGILAASSNITQRLAQKHPEIPILNNVNKQLATVYKGVRLNSHKLAPYENFGSNWLEALQEFIGILNQQEHCSLKFDKTLRYSPSLLTDEQENILYRSAQELLLNACKHSEASWIELKIEEDVQYLYLQIIDNGIGLSLTDKTVDGIGLSEIENQLKLIQGKMTIESQAHLGTKIKIQTPLK